MSEAFDPYHKWLGIPPQEQPPHHYRLLGVKPFEDDPDVIENAADRQMKHVRSFQAGPHSEASQRLLNELSVAKLCLLDPKRRSAYNESLKKDRGLTDSREMSPPLSRPKTATTARPVIAPRPTVVPPPPVAPPKSPAPVAEPADARAAEPTPGEAAATTNEPDPPVAKVKAVASPAETAPLPRAGSSVRGRMHRRRRRSSALTWIALLATVVLGVILVLILFRDRIFGHKKKRSVRPPASVVKVASQQDASPPVWVCPR